MCCNQVVEYKVKQERDRAVKVKRKKLRREKRDKLEVRIVQFVFLNVNIVSKSVNHGSDVLHFLVFYQTLLSQ